MPRALVLLFALLGASAADCTCGKGQQKPGTTGGSSAAAASSVPLVRQCYQGCLDLNEGKPIEQEQLKKNCAGRCVEICSKACAVPRKETPREQAMEECGEQCKKQLGLGDLSFEVDDD